MRELGKQIARWLATLVVIPTYVSYRLRSLVLGRDRALAGSSQLLSLLPGLVGCYLRAAFFHLALDDYHPTVRIEFGTLLSKAGTRFGKHAYIGPHCHLGLVDIGDDVLVAAGTHIPSGAHIHGTEQLDIPIREQPGEIRRVAIGDGAWLGAGSVVMADVGAASIVGAGSVVTQPIPAHTVAAGVPATIIRSRVPEDISPEAITTAADSPEERD